MGRWARKPVNHTSWVALVTPTDRPKSVRNRCLIELFCGVVFVVTLPLWHFCWCRGFCHRTESDLFLFPILMQNKYGCALLLPFFAFSFCFLFFFWSIFCRKVGPPLRKIPGSALEILWDTCGISMYQEKIAPMFKNVSQIFSHIDEAISNVTHIIKKCS